MTDLDAAGAEAGRRAHGDAAAAGAGRRSLHADVGRIQVTLDTPWSTFAVRTTLRLKLSLSRRAAATASSGNTVVPSM